MTEADKKTTEKTTENETETPKTDNEHQRKINVGNLPSDVTEQQLRDHFTGFEIEKVEIYHYRKYTLALLLFKDKEAATKAIAEKDGSMFRDRRLRIHLEYITIRHIKRDVIVTVVDNENVTEEQLWDKLKAAEVEPTSVSIFYPLGYVSLPKDADKPAILEKLTAAGFNAHDVNQRDQNQHLDIWRAAKLFFRNRNRVQLLNIPSKWIEDKEEMKKQCAEGGTITEAVSNNTNQNQNASNYARIFYETEEQATKAAAALNGRVVEGKRIHALYLESALIPDYKTSVCVSPLDKTITEEQVYDHFKQFGDIDFVNRRNCNDASIICFKNADSVEKAIACTTFPAPTEENKEATKEVTVKKYNGPLVLRPQASKRKLKSSDEGKTNDPEEKSKEQQDALKKLQAYHPVFVGNVPLSCPPLELKRYFAQHGPIKFMFSPQIMPYRTSAPHPVKTFIIYYNLRASANNACKFLDHKFFGGHRLHVLPLRGELSFDQKKTVKLTKIPYLSEDALFKKIKPFVGKINRIVKKSRLAAYVELNDVADVEKMLNPETADHPFPKGKMDLVKSAVNVRLYNENDSRVLGGIAKIVSKNPDMLKKTPVSQGSSNNKRARTNGPGFNQGPGGFNSNNNMNNPNAIQDLLRFAFMSGKNVGESLASNQGSFNAPDPPIANSSNFGDGGFGNRSRNTQGGGQNFRGQGRNQNNRGNNANNNASGNFQSNLGNNQNRGQNVNRGNQQNNQNRGNNDNGGNLNQNRGNNLNQNRPQQQNKQQNIGGNTNQNRNQGGGGGNLNRNQNRNQNRNNNFDNDSFGGGNNFGNNRNNFANDNFSNDNFGNNRNDNFSNDNFSGNNRNNFGGSNRNQNDGFSNSFGNNSNSSRFGNNDNQFSSNNFNNRNNRFDDDNNFGGNNQKGNFNQNRPNKQFNSGGGNQGGGMSFSDFSSSNRGNFGGGSNNFNPGNSGGNKWNNNSQQSNTGSRLAGSIFSRRF